MAYYYYESDYEFSPDDIVDDYDFEQILPVDIEHETDSVREAFEVCVQPSVIQIAPYIFALIGWSLSCRLLWTFNQWINPAKEWVSHLISVLFGFGVLYSTTGHNFLIVLLLALLAYIIILALEYIHCPQIGAVVAVTTICSHFVYEIIWDKPEAWQSIRGIQIVFNMKIISLAFDLERSIKEEQDRKREPTPDLVPFLGYLFCPATCVLGPWISYATYLRSLRAPYKNALRCLISSLANASLAVVFLCLSNCLAPLICSDHAWRWVRSYRDALSVRCSHYFICFLSQATLAAGDVKLNDEPQTGTNILGKMVINPLQIELPRSLSSLVRNWNIPMHDWLKMYVFRPAQKYFGSYIAAIISTYLVSSLLHGLHTEIYLVLLSLGVLAHAESVLREKLANIFNACIAVNPCRNAACPFAYCSSRGWRSKGSLIVLLVNLCFSLLAIVHLAYLGIIMHNAGNEDVEFSKRKVLGLSFMKWSQLDYLSHWIVLFTYFSYFLI